VSRADVERWIAAYERVWRAPGVSELASLFADDAVYSTGPYAEPVRGLGAIGTMWDEERTYPGEEFSMISSVVAVDGDVAVARIEVQYTAPRQQAYRDLWIMRFAADGRCREFEEWPFWPELPHVAP
jgi:ketosteroid isomerase-like protein